MKFRAYAKVNLGLEVLSRRPDGYHELRTLLQTVDLCDRLEFEAIPSGIDCLVDKPNIESGEGNLAYRAAALFVDRVGSDHGGIRIRIEKGIPAGRGLGGGSADAAVTLIALNELWSCNLSRAELHAMSSQLGMDVPFFLYGGTALAVGRGDEVYPLGVDLDLVLVIISPSFSISTAECYRDLRLTNRQVGSKLHHFVSALTSTARIDFAELANDLEPSAGGRSGEIQDHKKTLIECGAKAAMMSGSGSSVYGVFEGMPDAAGAATKLDSRGFQVFVSRALTRSEYERKLRVDQ